MDAYERFRSAFVARFGSNPVNLSENAYDSAFVLALAMHASGSTDPSVFRTAILRSGDTLLVIQPEEIGHGRSIVIVAGGSVTRPGLAYRQVERAAATLMSA